MTTSGWVRRCVYAVIVAAAVWALTTWVGMRPRPLLVALGVAACFAVGWLVADLAERLEQIDLTAPRRRVPTRHGLDPRFSSLARTLRDSREPSVVAWNLHATLVRVIDDRLARHHGIDRVTQPEQAQAVMGQVLSRYVDEPPRARRSQTAFLSDLLTRIEAL